MIPIENTRNFCIVAHIDHGKTTLSDRLLEKTGSVERRNMKEQFLDSMDLERERGITIKSHPVSMRYEAPDGTLYLLNLIDTPGHVDFAYEVSRSLAACEGVLLLVDAAQGIEAQTVANAHLAINQKLTVIPVINKIDLPAANVEACKRQIEDVLAIPADEVVLVSAKTGEGVGSILDAVLHRVPTPRLADCEQTRVLIFDCVYDPYKGVIFFIRVFSGSLKAGDRILMIGSERRTDIKEIGRFTPLMKPADHLGAGSVGYLVTSIKDVSEVQIGDTITLAERPAKEMLPGYKEIRPMVFSGIYPLDTSAYEKLKVSLGKLRLNDSSFVYQSESSVALGFGFRCGFLGLLHMEVIVERVRREYDLDIICTYPSVVYQIAGSDGRRYDVDNPVNMPDPTEIASISEPIIRATILTPTECIGDILSLIMEKRGVCDHTETLDETRLILECVLPLNEILVDFNDRIKSITKGYGSMDYELADYRVADLVKLEILLNGEPVDAFSTIAHAKNAESKGRVLCRKLKDILPRQMFKVAIQASIGSRVVARETISAMRKDVTAKCYGGDISRKRKLLDKQKEGKKRMKQVGKISIPQDAFIDILKSS